MGNVTMATYEKALKTLYSDREVKYAGYKNHPLVALFPKMDNFVGDSYRIPIWYGRNSSGSRDFATAKTNKGTGKYAAFSLTRKLDYGLIGIQNEVILASGNDKGAFLRAAKVEVDGTVGAVARNYAVSLYGTHGGARGVIGAIDSTALTLTNAADVVKFEVGMKLQHDTVNGTGTVEADTAVEITSIDRRSGILYAAAWTGFDVGNFLFREGDYGLAMHGLDSWIPTTTPTGGDSFLGVDRSVDTRLYGQYHDGSAQSMEEAVQDLDMKLNVEEGEPDILVMNPRDFNDFRKSLGSSIVRGCMKSPDEARVSFDTIVIDGMKSKINVLPDPLCPYGWGYMLDLSTWELCTLGGAPRILESMGVKFEWDPSADAIQGRVGVYGNLGCHAPGRNGKVKFR